MKYVFLRTVYGNCEVQESPGIFPSLLSVLFGVRIRLVILCKFNLGAVDVERGASRKSCMYRHSYPHLPGHFNTSPGAVFEKGHTQWLDQ